MIREERWRKSLRCEICNDNISHKTKSMCQNGKKHKKEACASFLVVKCRME